MAYTYDYSTAINAKDLSGVVTTNHLYSIKEQAVDYTHTSVILVPASSEVQIQLPGINSFVAVTVSSDGLFDVALSEQNNLPVYSGMYSNNYTRIIKDGTPLTIFFIKASSVDVEVKYSVLGLASI